MTDEPPLEEALEIEQDRRELTFGFVVDEINVSPLIAADEICGRFGSRWS